MTQLQIQLLGSFNITVGGSPLPGFHQPRLQSFLSYLLLHRQAPQSRQSIAFQFWPDSTEQQSRVNLRQLLNHDPLQESSYRQLMQLGPLRKARDVLLEASEQWRDLGNLPMLADCLSSICDVAIGTGDYEAALALSAEAQQMSQAIGNLWGQSYSLYKIGWVHWEYGRADRAIQVMEDGIHLGEQAGFLGAQTGIRRSSVWSMLI